jgi:uncharacterized membrane protein YuzA (DUF378 family)
MLNLIIFVKLLVIIGGIALGIYGLMGINLVKRILPNKTAQKVLYVCIGLSALILMFDKNFYLPFLGKTVVPKTLLAKDRVPINSTLSIEITVKPHSRVIYWASDKKNGKDVPVQVAYGEFGNSGITTADANGKAHLILKRPESYVVKKGFFKRKLRPHIHYRYSLEDGMLSEVHTRRLTKDEAKHLTSKKSKSDSSSSSSSKSSSLKSSSLKSSSSKSSSSKSDSNSPRSDLTKLKSCKCKLRHINLHKPNCQVGFSNSIIIPNPSVSMASSLDIVSSPTQYINPIEKYETDRSLEHVLQDRSFSSNNYSNNMNDYVGLEKNNYSTI